MARIKYFDDEFLEYYKVNFDGYLDMYRSKDVDLIKENFEDHILEGSIEFDYVELKTSKNSNNPERDNIKIIYESLKDLTPAQASQEKLWAGMYNTYYLEHLVDYIKRYENHKDFSSKLKGSIVYTSGSNRGILVQNIARLWWLGYYLYDDSNKENPYEYLDFYTDTKDIIGKSTAYFSSNITANKNILFGTLEAIKELVEEGVIENKREYYVAANKHLNIIGAVKLLDMMTKDDVKKEIKKHLRSYQQNK